MGEKRFFLIVNKDHVLTLTLDSYAQAKLYASKLKERNKLETIEIVEVKGNKYRRTYA